MLVLCLYSTAFQTTPSDELPDPLLLHVTGIDQQCWQKVVTNPEWLLLKIFRITPNLQDAMKLTVNIFMANSESVNLK